MGGETNGAVFGPVDKHHIGACVLTKQEMACIPTKSYACMSTPWSQGNVYKVKSWKVGERVTDALKRGPVS
jgi:hypothetical protein